MIATEDLGTLALTRQTTKGQVQIFARDKVKAAHVEVHDLTIIAAVFGALRIAELQAFAVEEEFDLAIMASVSANPQILLAQIIFAKTPAKSHVKPPFPSLPLHAFRQLAKNPGQHWRFPIAAFADRLKIVGTFTWCNSINY